MSCVVTGIAESAAEKLSWNPIDSIEAGSNIVVSVQSRRYRFAPRIIQVVDTLTDVDFQGQE